MYGLEGGLRRSDVPARVVLLYNKGPLAACSRIRVRMQHWRSFVGSRRLRLTKRQLGMSSCDLGIALM